MVQGCSSCRPDDPARERRRRCLRRIRSIALAVEEIATLCALLPYGQKLCSAVAIMVLKAPTGRIVLIIRLSYILDATPVACATPANLAVQVFRNSLTRTCSASCRNGG